MVGSDRWIGRSGTGIGGVTRVGAGPFLAFTVTAALIMSLVIDHFGWFRMSYHPLKHLESPWGFAAGRWGDPDREVPKMRCLAAFIQEGPMRSERELRIPPKRGYLTSFWITEIN